MNKNVFEKRKTKKRGIFLYFLITRSEDNVPQI